jgi:hypothetical protein
MEPYKAKDVIPIVAKMNGPSQQIKSCKTCIHPGQSPVGCPAQECHDCCQLSNWQEKVPLPRMGSGYSNQGGASSEDKHICDALLVEEGDRLASPSQQLLEYARGLKNEARLHNIAIGNIIKKLDEFMEGGKCHHLARKI